ncbi:hypothetical protein ACFSTE_13335 [Aquimarina hainanensis]|uniref:Immunity protein 63 domain-containing protein n=1 Tax=Aquimarina hainanensis TaxID=1578017 RepID=A0ABW5NA01_9FLAO
MELLINKSTVESYLNVAIGVSEKEFNTYIEEAQELDLKDILREEFYVDLVINREEDKWKLLIEGGKYSYNDREYIFSGIGKVLSYFTYARFILKGNITSTSHGFVIKKTPHSEPINLEERRNFYYKYREDAFKIFEGVKKYIERKGDYPSFKEDCRKSYRPYKTRIIQ